MCGIANQREAEVALFWHGKWGSLMRVGFKALAWAAFICSIELGGLHVAVADTTPGKQDAAAPGSADDKKPAEQTPAAGTPAVVVDDNSVESLLGKDVKSEPKGEKLGQITDILVSHGGEIRAAVIDFGGFLGVGSRKIAVAWPTLHFSATGLTLGMTRDELRVTPEYHQGEPIVIVGAGPTAPARPSVASPPGGPAAQPSPPATTK
jgi:PRC-barrel domain